jgi:hypothetical protein
MILISHTVHAVFAASEAWGYVASSLVLATFCMKRMGALRIAAIFSNVSFVAYGLLLHLMPIIVLHPLLMPMNCWRLFQAVKPKIDLSEPGETVSVEGWLDWTSTIGQALATMTFSRQDQRRRSGRRESGTPLAGMLSRLMM